MHACWVGKSIGGTLGLPAEGREGPLNFTFYDPIPSSAPPNDDLELQLVWLHLLETRGFALNQGDFAEAWLRHIHYMWDEYGRCRWNLRRGVPPAAAGTFENWFQSGMGSPIRSEIWACVCAGLPEQAARFAELDASIDHGSEGIAGEVYLATMQALVLGDDSLRNALQKGLEYIPPETETARAINRVFDLHSAGLAAWDAYPAIVRHHRNDNFTHAPLNVAFIVWALLYGDGDFDQSVLLGTNCGYDTDCTAATVGATLGMLLGMHGIERSWREPIGDAVYVGSGIRDAHAPRTLIELAERTVALHHAFRRIPFQGLPRREPTPRVVLQDLPGTILLSPLDGSAPVSWANGELPAAVLAAGGAEWIWTAAADQDPGAHIVALARHGARLWLDGERVIDCPPGLPFVPAVHRAPAEATRYVPASKNQRHVRLMLGSRDPSQEASVLLASPSLHLSPWNGIALPHRPLLPMAPLPTYS